MTTYTAHSSSRFLAATCCSFDLRLLFLEAAWGEQGKEDGRSGVIRDKGGGLLQMVASGGVSCIVEGKALRFGRGRDGGIFLLPDVKFIAQLNPLSYAVFFDFLDIVLGHFSTAGLQNSKFFTLVHFMAFPTALKLVGNTAGHYLTGRTGAAASHSAGRVALGGCQCIEHFHKFRILFKVCTKRSIDFRIFLKINPLKLVFQLTGRGIILVPVTNTIGAIYAAIGCLLV